MRHPLSPGARAGWAAPLLLVWALGATADDTRPSADAAGTAEIETKGPNTRAAESARTPQALTSKTFSNPYCTQPDPRQNSCYLNFRSYSATDNGTSAPYMLRAVVTVNSKPVFTMNLFFENSLYADHTMPGLGFRVACGPPPGNNYLLKVEPQDSLGNGMGYDQASVSCPPFDATQAAPVVSVSPASLASTQAPNTTASTKLTIANDAAFPLWWNLPISPTNACNSSPVPWLSVGLASGTTAERSSDPVPVTFNSTGLTPGHYAAHVCVQSGDTSTPQIDVPVALTVSCAPGPALAVTAPSSVGAGSPGRVASVRPNAGSTFTWGITNGTITAGQGTNAITFTAGASGTPVGLSVTETNPDPAVCIGTPGSASVPVLPAGSAILFYPVTPCRLLDTRGTAGPLGGPALAAGQIRTFKAATSCGVPSGATGVSMNVTVTQPAAAGQIVVFPGSSSAPGTSTLNFSGGQTRANNVLIGLARDGTGTFNVQNLSSGSVHVIADVNGYFY